MRTVALLLSLLFVFVAGCAETKSAVPSKEEYVEIDNPGYTMSPNAPPTIWVPRRYVDSGVPRGSELVKEGVEVVKGGLTAGGNPQQKQAGTVAPSQVAAAPAAPVSTAPAVPAAVVPAVKNRIAVLEVGRNGILAPFSEILKKSSPAILIDQPQIALLARYAALASTADKNTFAVRLQEDFGANLVIFVSAPDGIAPGKLLKAEIFDGMGGGLVRSVEATLPLYSEKDQAVRDSAVSGTLMNLVEQTREVLSLLPWYGKVVAVDGDRVYINAGREAGIQVGHKLKVYHGGKVVQGLGFAPGKMVGTVEVKGFVGTNGAYAVVKEGGGVLVSDLVSFE